MAGKGLGNNLETVVIAFLMIGIFLMDVSTELGIAAGMLYVVPIFIMTRLRNDRQIMARCEA